MHIQLGYGTPFGKMVLQPIPPPPTLSHLFSISIVKYPISKDHLPDRRAQVDRIYGFFGVAHPACPWASMGCSRTTCSGPASTRPIMRNRVTRSDKEKNEKDSSFVAGRLQHATCTHCLQQHGILG